MSRIASRTWTLSRTARAQAARPAAAAAVRPALNAKSRRLAERMARRGVTALSTFAPMRAAWGIAQGLPPGLAVLKAFGALCREKAAHHVRDQVDLLQAELAKARSASAITTTPPKIAPMPVAAKTQTANEQAIQVFFAFQAARSHGAAAAMTAWLKNKPAIEAGRRLVLADLDSEIAKASATDRAGLVLERRQFEN